jgi:trk system potassium uptake protein TrkA
MQKGVVLGLGEFGYYLALSLAASGVDLLVIDKNEVRVNKIKNFVTDAIIADVIIEDDLSVLIPDKHIDFAVISLGNLEASLLATLYFKDKNFKNLYVKAINDQHLRILKKLKIKNILFPERDSAERLGKTLSLKTILEYIPISSNYRLIEVKAISKIANKTLQELHFRKTYKLSIIAIKNESNYNFDLTAQTKIKKNDTLLVIVKDESIEKYNKLAEKEKKKFMVFRD